MTFELCTDSFEGAKMAQKYGAKRIELCSALSVGGLTPSPSLTTLCSSLKNVETHVMIRPREGNFICSNTDLEIMLKDISLHAKAGAKGVVFGCLTTDNQVGLQQNITLVEEARKFDLECTFHRAFDFVDSPKEALESLINIGFHRVLSSGGQPTAMEGVAQLRQMVNQANGHIEIMAGSGVNSSNALDLSNIGVDALHFTSHHSNTLSNNMGTNNTPNPDKIKSILNLF